MYRHYSILKSKYELLWSALIVRSKIIPTLPFFKPLGVFNWVPETTFTLYITIIYQYFIITVIDSDSDSDSDSDRILFNINRNQVSYIRLQE